jgi:hypothetical protein
MPARAVFSIQALHEPVDVGSNFTLSEIARLAEQTGWTGNHIPLGFSIARTGYALSLTVDAIAEAVCVEPVQVAVSIKLMDRHIEIAKDLAGDPACVPLARHHYILQAASNDAVLTQFMEELNSVLSQLTLPNLQHDVARADEDGERIDQMIRAAIDRVWPSLSVAMRAAAAGVDSPDEIAGLVHACLPANGTTRNSQMGTKL